MAQPAKSGMDFQAWKDLAEKDPEQFEKQRRALIEETIARAPVERRERLHRLQWRVDQTRRLSHTPLAACISLSQMMWESVTGRHGLLAAYRNLGQPVKPPAARVIQLHHKSHH